MADRVLVTGGAAGYIGSVGSRRKLLAKGCDVSIVSGTIPRTAARKPFPPARKLIVADTADRTALD